MTPTAPARTASDRRPPAPPQPQCPPVGSDAWTAQMHATLVEAFGRIARRRF